MGGIKKIPPHHGVTQKRGPKKVSGGLFFSKSWIFGNLEVLDQKIKKNEKLKTLWTLYFFQTDQKGPKKIEKVRFLEKSWILASLNLSYLT